MLTTSKQLSGNAPSSRWLINPKPLRRRRILLVPDLSVTQGLPKC
jgi:hypothetical protein